MEVLRNIANINLRNTLQAMVDLLDMNPELRPCLTLDADTDFSREGEKPDCIEIEACPASVDRLFVGDHGTVWKGILPRDAKAKSERVVHLHFISS